MTRRDFLLRVAQHSRVPAVVAVAGVALVLGTCGVLHLGRIVGGSGAEIWGGELNGWALLVLFALILGVSAGLRRLGLRAYATFPPWAKALCAGTQAFSATMLAAVVGILAWHSYRAGNWAPAVLGAAAIVDLSARGGQAAYRQRRSELDAHANSAPLRSAERHASESSAGGRHAVLD